MKKTLAIAFCAMFALPVLFSTAAAQQQQSTMSSATSNESTVAAETKKKRGPVFRANKEQITKAQAMLRERRLYTGEDTGKLDPATRASLKKYQEGEGMKATGTLNRMTLEKMGIALTDKQKAM